MANGRLASSMAMVSGVDSLMIVTSVNGMKAKLTATVSTHGKMETVTRVNGIFVSSMEQGQTYSLMVMRIQASMLMENPMAKVSTPGQMVHVTWVIL